MLSDPHVMRRSAEPFVVWVIYAFALAAGPLFLSRICLRFHRWLELGAAVALLHYMIGAVSLLTTSPLTGLYLFEVRVRFPIGV